MLVLESYIKSGSVWPVRRVCPVKLLRKFQHELTNSWQHFCYWWHLIKSLEGCINVQLMQTKHCSSFKLKAFKWLNRRWILLCLPVILALITIKTLLRWGKMNKLYRVRWIKRTDSEWEVCDKDREVRAHWSRVSLYKHKTLGLLKKQSKDCKRAIKHKPFLLWSANSGLYPITSHLSRGA